MEYTEAAATEVSGLVKQGPLGDGTQQMFIRGGSAPRSNPLPFYMTFFTKKVPLSYTFY